MKKSARSSPILQLFKSNNNNNGGVGDGATTANNSSGKGVSVSNNNSSGGGVDADNVSIASSVSITIRTLSKCFEGGVSMEDAVLNNDEKGLIEIDKAMMVNVVSSRRSPRHSFSSEDDNNNNKSSSSNKKQSSKRGSFNNIFKPMAKRNNAAASSASPPTKNNNYIIEPPSSPSKGSQSQANSNSNSTCNKTDQTKALTTSTTTGERLGLAQSSVAMKTGMMTIMPSSSPPPTPGSSNMILSTAATPTTSAGVVGGSMSGNSNTFWNNAQPATSSSSPPPPPPPPPLSNSSTNASSSPLLSTSAKAAADAVIGFISRAENFIVSSTGVSPASGTGFCSPRSSPPPSHTIPAQMEGIPEEEGDEHTDTAAKTVDKSTNNEFCIMDHNCFEFEDFGFNAFQDNLDANDNDNDKKEQQQQQQQQSGECYQQESTAASCHPQSCNPVQPDWTTTSNHHQSEQQHQKGYEIRLKSTFSQIKAREEAQREEQKKATTTPSSTVFGRTHPNTNYKRSISQPNNNNNNNATNSSNIINNDQNDFSVGSRALPDGLPFSDLSIPRDIEHSVSELTMRSHGAFERHKYTSDSRRMAYYAVGRTSPNNNGNDNDDNDANNNNNKAGGNRRCYFTGHPIPYGMPFYAGSVQQGPRTLVVFCLPSALALGLPNYYNNSPNNAKKMSSSSNNIHQFSSKFEREKYLESLPEPDTKLLQEMSRRYPEPFDTLPVQVRSPHCWRLFVKFCFFSGLPIAEGEMHYRVKSSVPVLATNATKNGEDSDNNNNRPSAAWQLGEIALSHEVMEGKLTLGLVCLYSFLLCFNTLFVCICNFSLTIYPLFLPKQTSISSCEWRS